MVLEVFIMVKHIDIFSDVVQWSLVEVYRRFGKEAAFIFQEKRENETTSKRKADGCLFY
jgi:hypothetical protein